MLVKGRTPLTDEPENSEPVSDLIPQSGRVVGIDYGTVRIGIAISDPGQSIASPMEILQSRGDQGNAKYFRSLILEESPVGFVVGLPLHMSGESSGKSREAVAFGRWLRQLTGLPVAFTDERYSTAMAKEICRQLGLSGSKRKAHLDKIAAQVILASWLERLDRQEDSPGSIED